VRSCVLELGDGEWRRTRSGRAGACSRDRVDHRKMKLILFIVLLQLRSLALALSRYFTGIPDTSLFTLLIPLLDTDLDRVSSSSDHPSTLGLRPRPRISTSSKFYFIPPPTPIPTPTPASYVGLDPGKLDLELAFVVTDTVTGPDLRHVYGYDHGNTVLFLFLVPDTDTRTVLQTDMSWYRAWKRIHGDGDGNGFRG
jgi:hypothetical protein